MEQQSPGPLALMLEPRSGGLPRLDIAAVEKDLPPLDPGVAVADIGLSITDRLDLGTTELDATLIFIENVEIAECLLICGNVSVLAHHVRSRWESP